MLDKHTALLNAALAAGMSLEAMQETDDQIIAGAEAVPLKLTPIMPDMFKYIDTPEKPHYANYKHPRNKCKRLGGSTMRKRDETRYKTRKGKR